MPRRTFPDRLNDFAALATKMAVDQAPPTPPEIDRPYSARLWGWTGPFALLLVGLSLLSIPDQVSLSGIGLTIGILLAFVGLFCVSVWRQSIPSTAFVVLFAIAYAANMSTGVEEGFHGQGYIVYSDGAARAYVVVALFMAMVLLVTVDLSGRKLRLLDRIDDYAASHDEAFLIGLLVLLAATAVAAFRTGTWTSYGAGEFIDTTGQFRPELYYSTVLSSVFLAGLRQYRTARTWGFRWFALGAAGLSGILLFAYQSRHMLVGTFLTAYLVHAGTNPLSERPKWSKRWTAAATAAAVLLLVQVGSLAWRNSALDNPDLALKDRLTESVQRIPAVLQGDDSVVSEARRRITYAAADAVALEYLYERGDNVGLSQVLLTQTYTALPGLLFPEKYRYPALVCETVFAQISHETDVACTPVGEALIYGGFLGVVVVAVAWGLMLATAEAFLKHRSGALTVAGTIIIRPVFDIEASSFPMIGAIRAMVTILVFVAPVTLLASLIRPRATNVED